MTVVAPKIPAHDPRAATPLGVAALRLGLTPQPLIALTRDARLVVTLKKVTDPAHAVLPVGSEVDLSKALLAHQGGVAVIDCAAVATSIIKLIDRVHAQFPELVLIVAGSAKEQGMLAAQITDGSVHRFLHRPVSEQRVRLFVEAAWRRHAQGGLVPEVPPATARRSCCWGSPHSQGWQHRSRGVPCVPHRRLQMAQRHRSLTSPTTPRSRTCWRAPTRRWLPVRS